MNQIELSQSAWIPWCLLVPKDDGSYRFCAADFHRVKTTSPIKSDSFSILRVEDYIDHSGHSKYITKLDLLKGYWQVPFSINRAKEISAFTMPNVFSIKGACLVA